MNESDISSDLTKKRENGGSGTPESTEKAVSLDSAFVWQPLSAALSLTPEQRRRLHCFPRYAGVDAGC